MIWIERMHCRERHPARTFGGLANGVSPLLGASVAVNLLRLSRRARTELLFGQLLCANAKSRNAAVSLFRRGRSSH